MDLIVWRHAHAGDPWPDPVLDLQRPLSAKGCKQAERMARWLSQRLTDSTRIVASPALRTRQTAEALGRPFKTLDALAPGATVSELLAAARFPAAGGATLVVGHQDTLGLLAAHLMGAADPSWPWNVRKGAVWWWRLRTSAGPPPPEQEVRQALVLHAVMTPELLR